MVHWSFSTSETSFRHLYGSLEAIIVVIISSSTKMLLDLFQLSRCKRLFAFATLHLGSNMLLFGWVDNWDNVAAVVTLQDAVVEHLLDVLGLLVQLLVLRLHLLHLGLHLGDLLDLFVQLPLLLHCTLLIFEYSGS